jgi:hypothetical protein
MYIAMNRINIALGQEDVFEIIRKNRKSNPTRLVVTSCGVIKRALKAGLVLSN